MKVRTNLNIRFSMYMLLLAVVGTATGEIIFLDDFAGDGSSGRFVMEAENYSSRTPGAGAEWRQVSGSDNTFIEGAGAGQVAPTAKGGARGDYMEVLGQHPGDVAPTDDFYNGPFLDYKISVETPGTYRLYMRWTGRDQGSDSLYAFILKPDNMLLTGAGPNYFLYHQYRKDWVWDSRGVKDTTRCAFAGFPHSAVWTISEPGDYTIRVAHRESGTALDAIVFQTTNLQEPSKSDLLQSLFVPETVKLSPRQVMTINDIRHTIAEKVEVLERIDAALEKNLTVYKALTDMLEKSEYGNLTYSGLVTAKQEIYSAIQYEQQSKEALEKSIQKLKDGLGALGFKLERGVVW